jgi:hypothetical protein
MLIFIFQDHRFKACAAYCASKGTIAFKVWSNGPVGVQAKCIAYIQSD